MHSVLPSPSATLTSFYVCLGGMCYLHFLYNTATYSALLTVGTLSVSRCEAGSAQLQGGNYCEQQMRTLSTSLPQCHRPQREVLLLLGSGAGGREQRSGLELPVSDHEPEEGILSNCFLLGPEPHSRYPVHMLFPGNRLGNTTLKNKALV